jgi:hypothetical protein
LEIQALVGISERYGSVRRSVLGKGVLGTGWAACRDVCMDSMQTSLHAGQPAPSTPFCKHRPPHRALSFNLIIDVMIVLFVLRRWLKGHKTMVDSGMVLKDLERYCSSH